MFLHVDHIVCIVFHIVCVVLYVDHIVHVSALVLDEILVPSDS